MKKLLVIALLIVGCQKNQVIPSRSVVVIQHTIPDGASIKIKFMYLGDTVYSDETILQFSRAFSPLYVHDNQDAPHLNGFGKIGSELLSSDGIPLTIDGTSPGAVTGYQVFTKLPGTHRIRLSLIKSLPVSFHVWLHHGPDSTDIRQTSYDFIPDTGIFKITVTADMLHVLSDFKPYLNRGLSYYNSLLKAKQLR